jgi:hypothetical protein
MVIHTMGSVYCDLIIRVLVMGDGHAMVTPSANMAVRFYLRIRSSIRITVKILHIVGVDQELFTQHKIRWLLSGTAAHVIEIEGKSWSL